MSFVAKDSSRKLVLAPRTFAKTICAPPCLFWSCASELRRGDRRDVRVAGEVRALRPERWRRLGPGGADELLMTATSARTADDAKNCRTRRKSSLWWGGGIRLAPCTMQYRHYVLLIVVLLSTKKK